MVRKTGKNVSLTDVARVAGVSANTVSRVVRGDPEVASDTRQRIAELIRKLNYRPNYAARSLVGNRTGMIQILLAAPLEHGHATALLEIVDALAESGFQILISDCAKHSGDYRYLLKPEDLIPFQVDGILVLGGLKSSARLAHGVSCLGPTVIVFGDIKTNETISSVYVDNAQGEEHATTHLISQGTKYLVHLAGPKDWLDANKRRSAFIRTCESAKVKHEVIDLGTWDSSQAFEVISQMKVLPDGIVASNDRIAMGAMKALHKRKVKIGTECKVIGFDNIYEAEYLIPSLSTVRQPYQEVGKKAVQLLRCLISEQKFRSIKIAPELIIRESSIGDL